MKKLLLLFCITFFVSAFISSKKRGPVDWSNYDVNDKFKINLWKANSFKKTAKTDTYLHSFAINQVLIQKGALTNKQSFSTGIQLKASAGLVGLNDDKMRTLSTDLYNDFKKEMTSLGTKWVDGSEIIKASFLQKKASKISKLYVGSGNVSAVPYKISSETEGAIISYHPKNYNYVIDARSVGNGIYSFATKTKTNFLSVNYKITFCEFDASTGGSLTSKSANIKTLVRMKIEPLISINTSKGGWGTITYKKPIVGNNNFTSDQEGDNGSKIALSKMGKIDNYITIDPDKYEEELRTALFAIQKSILKELKNEF